MHVNLSITEHVLQINYFLYFLAISTTIQVNSNDDQTCKCSKHIYYNYVHVYVINHQRTDFIYKDLLVCF